MKTFTVKTFQLDDFHKLDKLSKDDIKAELCIVVRSMMNIKSKDLRHRYIYLCENRSYIQRVTYLEPHTIEVTHNPDVTIPGAYNRL